MKIMGLDLSTKSSGYSVFDNGKLIDYGCITATSDDVIKRIKKMTKEIDQILDKEKPDLVGIEDPIPAEVGSNIDTYKKLTWLQGYIVTLLHDKQIPYELIVSSHWRKACGINTGRGIKRGSLKNADINFVKQKFNIDVNDDIADSCGIAWSLISETKEEEGAF